MRAAWFLLACQGPLSRLCVRRCVVPCHAPADTEPCWVNRGGGNDGSVSEPDTGTLQVILTTVCFCPLKLVIRGRTLPRTPRGAEQGGAPPPPPPPPPPLVPSKHKIHPPDFPTRNFLFLAQTHSQRSDSGEVLYSPRQMLSPFPRANRIVCD